MLPSSFKYTTEKLLSTVALPVEDFGKIIQNLHSNKAHGHDNISICMIKICGDSIYKLLEIVFGRIFLTNVCASEWKNGTNAPVHKKSDKQNI